MKMKQWRLIHRLMGLFVVGFILFYALTGILLNHRKFFNNFLTQNTTVLDRPLQNMTLAEDFIAQCRKEIGDDRDPEIIIIRDGRVDFRYDRHGSEAVLLDPKKGTISTVTRVPQEPWHAMKWLHVVYRTGDVWKLVSDFAAILMVLTALSGLFCLRYRQNDLLALLAGVLLLCFGLFIGWS